MENKQFLILTALSVLKGFEVGGLSEWSWMKQTQIESGLVLSTAEKSELIEMLLEKHLVISYRESLTGSLRFMLSDVGRVAKESLQ